MKFVVTLVLCLAAGALFGQVQASAIGFHLNESHAGCGPLSGKDSFGLLCKDHSRLDYRSKMPSLLPDENVDAKILRFMAHADNRRVLSRFRLRRPFRLVHNENPAFIYKEKAKTDKR